MDNNFYFLQFIKFSIMKKIKTKYNYYELIVSRTVITVHTIPIIAANTIIQYAITFS